MTYIPPGITYPEIQKIADERDQARARVEELEAELIEVQRKFANSLRDWGDRLAHGLPPETE